MNFSEKGWLRRYLQLRNHYTLQKEYQRLVALPANGQSPDAMIYGMLQPTGMLYGQPTNVPIAYRALLRSLRIENLNSQHILRIILVESLLNSALFSPRYANITRRVDVADALLEAANSIGKFYASLYPHLPVKKSGRLIKKEPRGMELSEYMISLRIGTPTNEQKFWTLFLKHSMIFVDILYFGPWLFRGRRQEESEKMRKGHQRLRFLILKVIIAAAYANQQLESEEKAMLQAYLDMAGFDEKMKERAERMLRKGVEEERINFEKIKSPVLRRHLIELAILTVSSDRDINEQEMAFLERFRQKLNISPELYRTSLIAVTGFVIEHGQLIPFVNDKNTLEDHFHRLMQQLLQQQSEELSALINQNPKLSRLLAKRSTEKMSTENRKIIRQELTETIRQLHSLEMTSLPRSYLTYPVLMDLLPEKLISS
jgi:hypothetical protein